MSFGFGNIHSLLTPGATGRQTQVMFGRKQNPSRPGPSPGPWLTPGRFSLFSFGISVTPHRGDQPLWGVICVIWFREYSFPTHARSHGKADTGNVWEKTKPFQAGRPPHRGDQPLWGGYLCHLVSGIFIPYSRPEPREGRHR